jgi:pSer/pThr/pTyr-binding forkhead associated (FHA) protein
LPGDDTVSRRHCLLELAEDGAWVRDLGSRNGTRLNGEPIGPPAPDPHAAAAPVGPPRPLQAGDVLRLGNHLFLVALSDRPSEPVASSAERHDATANGSGRGTTGGPALPERLGDEAHAGVPTSGPGDHPPPAPPSPQR